jgi:hypothetical protein
MRDCLPALEGVVQYFNTQGSVEASSRCCFGCLFSSRCFVSVFE